VDAGCPPSSVLARLLCNHLPSSLKQLQGDGLALRPHKASDAPYLYASSADAESMPTRYRTTEPFATRDHLLPVGPYAL